MLTDLITNFGDVIKLKDQQFDLNKMRTILDASEHWHQYNPRKNVNRFGLSLTSLDGGYSGVPDLDSLREYNAINKTNYVEDSFTQYTPMVEELGLTKFLDLWQPHLGRSHCLRLDAGGFFPPHRDNGLNLQSTTVRILIPVRWKNAVWIQDGQLLNLEEGAAYFLNTTKIHSLFSYQDGNILIVLNVNTHPVSLGKIISNAHIL